MTPRHAALLEPPEREERVRLDPTDVMASLNERRGTGAASRRGWMMRRLLLGADVLGLLAAFLITAIVAGNRGANDAFSPVVELAFFMALVPLWVIGAKVFGLYANDEERVDHTTSDDLVRVFLMTTVGVFLISNAAELTRTGTPDNGKTLVFWVAAIAMVTASRASVRAGARRHPAYQQPTLIVGAGRVGQLIARKLVHHPEYRLRLVGFVDTNPRSLLRHVNRVPVLGGIDELNRIVSEHEVERVVFAFTNDSHEELLPLVRHLRDSGVQVDMVPRLFEVMGPKIDIHTVEGTALVGLPPVKPDRSTRLVKRTIDVVGAMAILLVTAPLLAVIAIAVKLDSPGPVLFRQPRLGEGMRSFTLFKFRTMQAGEHEDVHRAHVSTVMDADVSPDERGLFKLDQGDLVTRSGRHLRRLSLDELPQLFNVLRGDMSLVGPRPCMWYEVDQFAAHHFERFLVPPGLTGLWQVSARAHSTFGEALDLDVLYAQSHSIGLDLMLLVRTPFQLLRTTSTV